MRPNARELALRDPAMAALMGVIPSADFGAEFGDDEEEDYGAEFGDDDDDDYGAAAIQLKSMPSNSQLQQMWKAKAVSARRRRHRTLLLNPNRGSAVKIEKYILSLSDEITIGTGSAVSLESSPDCTFRPQRFTMVVPTPGFVTITDIKMANVSINIGSGLIDAFQFNANGVGQQMDLPTLTPANRARVTGAYTGFLGGFPDDTVFLLSATFIGPSSLAGGTTDY